MFNLQKNAQITDDLLKEELEVFGITNQPDSSWQCCIGDENINIKSLNECISTIQESILELKKHLWEDWQDLANVADVILHSENTNLGSLDNLIFLNAVKKSYLLSRVFSDLTDVSTILKKIFYLDATDIHGNLISKFNLVYLRIRLLHHLIMHEIYRLKLLTRCQVITRQSQVSGPWANLDLPMKERVWEWNEEDDEYFNNRSRARREQVRYNPENNKAGFYYVWQDLSRDPYLFMDMVKDSPYKSRHLLTIASSK